MAKKCYKRAQANDWIDSRRPEPRDQFRAKRFYAIIDKLNAEDYSGYQGLKIETTCFSHLRNNSLIFLPLGKLSRAYNSYVINFKPNYRSISRI